MRVRLSRRDDGFTLVELLVVIVVLGVIVAPLTAAIVVYLRNTERTTDRMAESHDAQIAALWFTRDVQNVGVRDWGAGLSAQQSIEVNAPATGGRYPCGGAETPEALVRFAWTEPVAGGTPDLQVVSYVVAPAGEERQLRRLTCDGSGSITSELVVARHLDPSTNPVVTCRDGAGGSVPCSVVPPPASVELRLTLRAPASVAPYTVTLIGQRRQT